MPDAFDGAGKPFTGASYRALLIILVVVIAGVVLVWIGASWGMELLDIERSGPMQPVVP